MHKFSLRTKATPYSSRKLGKAAMGIISDAITDHDQLFNFDLALSEACANVVRHAYKDMDPRDIEIVVTIRRDECIELDISDWGRGFPSWPVDVKNAEPHAEGGRGLFIMSELADSFTIDTTNGKHTVHIKKCIRKELWKPSE